MSDSEPAPLLHFHPDYRAAVLEGRKQTTVRYGGAADPMPKLGSVQVQFGDAPQVWPARITRLEARQLGELTQADAKADGFGSVGELLERLRFHYPNLPADAAVTVVHFELHHPAQTTRRVSNLSDELQLQPQ